jgi:integrase
LARPSVGLAELLTRYKREITPNKKSKDIESVKIDVILKDDTLPRPSMAVLSSADIAAWRDRRLKVVKGGTVNREIDVLSTAINHARREWRIRIENPVALVKRPEKARSRDRRLTEEEEHYLSEALEEAPRRTDGTFAKAARNPYFMPVMKLALETAMRRGELLVLEWGHVDLERCTAHLPDTKNRDPRTVPLSTRAAAIFKALPKPHKGRVFPLTPMALRKGFARGLERARKKYVEDCEASERKPNPAFLADVHFHDTRLLAWQRAQAQEGLGRRPRPDAGDDVAEVLGAAAVAALMHHDEQSRGRERGELVQRCQDEGTVPVNAARSQRHDRCRQARLREHAPHGVAMHLQLRGNGADAPVFGLVQPRDLRVQLEGDDQGGLLHGLGSTTRAGQRDTRP